MDQNNVDTTGSLHYPPSLCGLPCLTFTFIDAKSVSFKGFCSKVRCFDHGGVKDHTARSHIGNPRWSIVHQRLRHPRLFRTSVFPAGALKALVLQTRVSRTPAVKTSWCTADYLNTLGWFCICIACRKVAIYGWGFKKVYYNRKPLIHQTA